MGQPAGTIAAGAAETVSFDSPPGVNPGESGEDRER